MGGKGRGKNKGKKKTVTVTEEQGAIKENETETETVTVTEEQGVITETETETETETDLVALFNWYFSRAEEMEDGDLYDRCVFLIRAQSSNIIPTKTTSINPQRPCYQEDFHYIDLATTVTLPHYFPSIINCVGPGTTVSFNSRQVYIFGDRSRPLIQHNHDVDVDIHKHTGASFISARYFGTDDDWEPFVRPDTNQKTINVNAAVLSGNKIYYFGSPILCPQVCCPNVSNIWNPLTLPDYLVNTPVSFPLLPDPLNNRIILHFPSMAMLYAFHPDENEGARQWKEIASHFYTWNCIAAAISDNVIFFIPEEVHGLRDFVLAFDLTTSAWLRIVWDFTKIDKFLIVYDAIFTLSDQGLMCLASGICKSSVRFLRFRVKRTSDTHLKLTALDYHIYDIPCATRISDIILLKEPEL